MPLIAIRRELAAGDLAEANVRPRRRAQNAAADALAETLIRVLGNLTR